MDNFTWWNSVEDTDLHDLFFPFGRVLAFTRRMVGILSFVHDYLYITQETFV